MLQHLHYRNGQSRQQLICQLIIVITVPAVAYSFDAFYACILNMATFSRHVGHMPFSLIAKQGSS